MQLASHLFIGKVTILWNNAFIWLFIIIAFYINIHCIEYTKIIDLEKTEE